MAIVCCSVMGLLLADGLDAQNLNRVSPAEKRAFLLTLESLQRRGEFYTDEAIDSAASQTRVLLALTRDDIEAHAKIRGCSHNDFIYPVVVLVTGLCKHKDSRDYALRSFEKISHPEIQRMWAVGLFHSGHATAEINQYLRDCLMSKRQSMHLEGYLGKDFDRFRKEINK